MTKCEDDVAQRLLKLQSDTVTYGMKYISGHWKGLTIQQVANDRVFCRQHLEGVDVFWDNPTGTRDGHLDSQTKFGKMYVVPYPFHCVIVYDDAPDESFIRDNDQLRNLVALNTHPEILKKKEIRVFLRALSRSNIPIYFPFQRLETETVEDGTETYRDSDGNTQTRTVYSTVTFNVYYKSGVIAVTGDTDKVLTAGFNVR
jgi:hypothetical protein